MSFERLVTLLSLVATTHVVYGSIPIAREDLKEVMIPRGSPIDERAMQTILHGVQQEQPESLYLFAMVKFYGHGVDQNVEAAVTLLNRAAERGHSDAEFALGVLYGRGDGVVHSNTLSASWLAKSAAHGHNDATWMLATMYIEGRGVSEDITRAVKLLQDAAKTGNKHAKFHLGILHEYGRGVAQNFTFAAELYQQAGERVPDALYHLGLLYLHGRGMDQSFRNARKHILKAANLGSAQAMYALGQMHIYGQGSIIDYSQALYWLKRAADQDDVRIRATASTVVKEIEFVLNQAELQVKASEHLLGVPIRAQISNIDGNYAHK